MNRERAAEIAARLVAVFVPLVCAAYGLANPGSVLFGGVAWLVMLATSVVGYGSLVERAAQVEVDVGLRMAWGAGAYLAIAGPLLAIGVLSAPVLAILIIAGYGAYAWRQWTTPRPALVAAVRAVPRLASDPAPALFFGLIAVIAAVNLAGAVAELEGNTYDDDVVYTPLVKRVLDIGDIDEPFSFRRISAFGGQTALAALAATRGTLANIYLVDGALFQLIMLLLVVGLARQRERANTVEGALDGPAGDHVLFGLLMLVVVTLPSTSINTGSHWTGVVMFLGLYRTLALTTRPEAPLGRLFAISGALAAGACTLRQNFIPVAVMFPLIVLVIRLGRKPWQTFRAERRLWLATVIGGAVVLIPYCIASWRSNETFLYPFFLGTFNPNIPTQPMLFSPWQELQFFIKVLLEPDPIRVIVFLLPVLLLARDTRPGRPFLALLVASILGFTLLCHKFTLSDQHNMWRYAFGFVFPLFMVFVVEGGAAGLRRSDTDAGPIRVPLIGRVLLIASLIVQLALSARGMARKYSGLGADLQLAVATHSRPLRAFEIPRVYAELQASAPTGATIAIALDEPFHLDFARNRILNIDTPGFASWAPGMPVFRGPEPVAEYFLAHGIQHLAFVRGAFSRYQYRREFWVRRTFTDSELWRVQGAYAVDCLDNFEALAASRSVLYERDGMVMVDLAVRR